jgi:hypothetical protein
MTSVLERVRKLIALAASPNVEEARSAAFLACSLIREHSMALSMPAEEGRFQKINDVTKDPFSDFFGSTAGKAPRPITAEDLQRNKPPRAPPVQPKGKRRRGKRSPVVKLTNRYPMQCRGCGVSVPVGATIYWRDRLGSVCERCGPEPLRRAVP